MDQRGYTHYAADYSQRLTHLQKSQTYMKCYKGSWCNWMTKDG